MWFYSPKIYIILCLNFSHRIQKSLNYSRASHELKIMQGIKYLTESGFRKEIPLFLKIILQFKPYINFPTVDF